MFKKIIVIVGLLFIVGFSFTLLRKTKTAAVPAENPVQAAVSVPETIFTFNLDHLAPRCRVTDPQLCAVEAAVKCTINPNLDGCESLDLPKFIFMRDPGLERPTEISYKILNKKVLINNTTEIHTDSACNGGWFGLCQGTVIYVLAQNEQERWYVKDIYAIE